MSEPTECDCCGPNARTTTGECAVLAEVGLLRALRLRRLEGNPATEAEVDEMCAAAGLPVPGEVARRRRDERERGNDGQGMEWRLQRLGVPTRALLVLRGNVQETPALQAAKKYMQAPAGWLDFLTLLGPTGVGKTVSAAWVFREVARHTSPDRPTGSPEPLAWVQAPSFTHLSAYESDDVKRLEWMKGAKLLVVDELGDEATALGVSAVVEVLMAREAKGRRTVLTSNLLPEPFQRRYGAAVWDRLDKRGLIPGLAKEKSRRERATP